MTGAFSPTTPTVDLAHDLLGTDQAGTPLVILHGLFGAARNWSSLGKRLARKRPVILVDLRNHGRSPHSDTMDYPDMAADVAALLDRLRIEDADFIGHSMGGKVAMVLALASHDLVRRLVIADIAPVGYEPESRGFESYIDAMLAVPMDQLSRRAEVSDHLEDAVPDRAVRAFLLGNVETADGGGLRWTVNLEGIRDALPAIYGFPDMTPRQFDRPTVFLRGADSPYVLADHRPVIKALFPAAQQVSLARAGHWLHADQPEAFVSAVEAFLG